MMKIKRLSLIQTLTGTLLFLAVIPLLAESLTLDEAVQRALVNNHKIKQMAYQVEESKTGIGLARSQFMPQVNFYQTFQRTNNAPQSFFYKLNQRQLDMANTDFNHPGTNNDVESKLQVTQPLFTGGKLSAGLDLSRKEAEVAQRQKEQTESDIVFQTAQLYYQLLVSTQYLQVANQAVTDAKEHFRVAQVQFEEGRGIKSDMLRAQVFLTQMEQVQLKTKTNLEISKRQLAIVLGEDPGKDISIRGTLTYSEQTIDAEKQISLGLINRKEMQELQLRKQETQLQKKIVQGDFLPTVGLIGQWQMNSDTGIKDDADSWYAAMVVSYPLFDGMSRNYKLRKVTATSHKMNEMQQELEQGIKFEISKAVLNLDEARKRVELTRHLESQADESLRLTELRYQNGLSTLTDLNDAQTALNQSRVDAIQSLADYNVALIGIDYTSGTLTAKYQTSRNSQEVQ